MADIPSGRLLLRDQGTAAPVDSKTVQVFRFDVPEGVSALALRFDYQPRYSSDAALNTSLVDFGLEKYVASFPEVVRAERLAQLKREPGIQSLCRVLNNLMNVTLIDAEGGWRGRWDRNPSSADGALLLGRRCASRGFIPGPLPAGTWQAAVECHIVVGEPVKFHLEVETRGEEDERALAQRLSLVPKSKAARAPGGRRWYFGEMHSHTVHSDGRHELAELADRCRANGCEFVALTDHNAISGHLEGDPLPVTLLPGCELTTFHGHHPIYGLKEMIPWHRDGQVLSFAEISRGVRAKGGLTSLAHPVRSGDPICTGCRMPDDLDPDSYGFMEVWYKRWDGYEDANCAAAYALWNEHWKQGRRVTALAARDWHGPGQESPWPGPMPLTGLFAEDDSPEALLAALRRGEVILSGGPVLELVLENERGQARVGGKLQGAARMRLGVERLDGPAELRVYRSGELAHRQAVGGDGAIQLDSVADRPGFYRAELWRGELPRVITNHVVVE